MRGAIAGVVGVVGLLVLAPGAQAGDREHGGTASGGESEARGSGMAGSSTGARPGEVTGAPAESGTSAAESGTSAAESGTSAEERRAERKADQELSATVERYDRANRTLSFTGSDRKLKLTDDTQVFKAGTRVSPGQIMEGDEVRASYSGSGDSLEAARIEITGSDAATGSMEPGPSGGAATKGGSPKDTAAGAASDTGSGSTGTKQAK